jgi:hypothetical protein
MTTKNMGRNQALAAALTLLGASLGVSTPAGAAETTGLFLKGHDTTTSKQIKGETTSNQYKEHPTSQQQKFWAPKANFLKLDATKSNQIKLNGNTQSHQIKGEAPNN